MAADLDQSYKTVLDLLLRFKSMPFLELTSICELDDKKLEQIVLDLEQRDLVKVNNRADPLEQVVTVKEKAFSFKF